MAPDLVEAVVRDPATSNAQTPSGVDPGTGDRVRHRQRPPQQGNRRAAQDHRGLVKVHLHSIYQKLGVDSRLALMLYARETAIA